MPTFDVSQRRSASLDALKDGPFDVLVVGGGIVGAGIARDAAMRGLRTALVERHDLAFGTSSRSSRLLHGGIRYLAQGRLGLVFEASREKGVLARIAPHLVLPLPFLFPTYSGTAWPRWQLRIGVKIYDLLCGGRNFGRSYGLNAAEMQKELPLLNDRRLTGGVCYYDALTNDARLTIDTLCSAERAGASVANYVRLVRAEPKDNGWTCSLLDTLGDRPIVATARSVVNATGPWANQFPQAGIRLRLTKGIHIVIDRNHLPVDEAVVLTEDQRILFVLPWGDRVIIGTTDTDYSGEPENVRAEPDDIAYVLESVNQAFPGLSLTHQDVLATWAGLRPLIADPRGRPSDISRRHEILMGQPGWLDVAGGKLTTYRLIAQQAVDRIVRYLRIKAKPCRTAVEPLLPDRPATLGVDVLPPAVGREAVRRAVEHEWAVHLDDVMLRRTSWSYYQPQPNELAAQVADWMAEMLGWTSAERDQELARLDGSFTR